MEVVWPPSSVALAEIPALQGVGLDDPWGLIQLSYSSTRLEGGRLSFLEGFEAEVGWPPARTALAEIPGLQEVGNNNLSPFIVSHLF